MTKATAAAPQLRAPAARHLATGAAVLSLAVFLTNCEVGKLTTPPTTGSLLVSPLQLTDSAAVGSAALRVRSLELMTEASPELDWQAQKAQGSSWLVVPASGNAPDTVTVSLNPAGLAVGVYRDTIVVTSSNTSAEPLRVPVEFQVHPCRDAAVTLDTVVNAALSNADCGSPARPGHYARRYRFGAAADDSLSVELQATGFNGFIRIDTVTASPAPTPYPPSLVETDECLGAMGDPCIHYLRLPATRDYVVEVTTNTAGATGTIAMSVHRPRLPLAPDTLTERAVDSVTPLRQPGNVSENTALVLRATVDDPDGVDTLRLEVEIQPLGTPFSGTPTAVSGTGPVDRRAFIALSGLNDDTQYHWQARTVDQTGRASAWVSAGANPETSPDFTVNVPEAPGAPTGLGQFRQDGTTPIALGGLNNTPTAVFKGVVTDADPGDQLRLEVEVKPVGTPFNQTGVQTSTPVATGVTVSATVSGLVDGTAYHWRARTVDQTARASAWVSFGGNPESGTDFSVEVPAQGLEFLVQPSTVVAGAAITPAVQVRAVDAQGGTLTSFTGAVTISIESGPAGGTITGTPTVNAVAGVATFTNLRFPKVGVYTLRATSGGLFATSGTFTVMPAPAAKLAFTIQPATTQAGVTMPAVQVTAQDPFDNTATSFTAMVTVTLGTNPGGDGVLDGTTSVPAVAGVATFSTLDIDEADTSYTLTASAAGLTGATSTPFNIFTGGVCCVRFNAQPTTTVAGVNMATVQVRAVDVSGNTVTTFNGQILLEIASGPGGATLLGTNPRTANSGIASFNNLRIEKAGTYTLRATVVGSPVITPDTSVAFTILPAAPSKLAFTVQPPATTTAGTVMAPAIVVAVQDQFDNTVTSSTANVAIAILNNPGSGTLSGTTSAAASGGLATFGSLSINKSGVGYTLRATSTGLSSATSNGFTIQAGPAVKLTFSVPPSNTVAGVAFSPTVQVTALDAFDNTATSFTGNVTVAIGTNPPPGGGVLDGSNVVAAVAGVANFPGLNIDEARNGYTLIASATNLISATSGAFNITSDTATQLAFTTQPPTSTTAGQAFSVQVTARDQFGNTATTFAGTVNIAIGTNPPPGTGVLDGTTSMAAVAGVANFAALDIDEAAVGYTLTANSTGLTGATSNSFTVTPLQATNLAFTVQPTDEVAGAVITPAVQVTARDEFGNTVTTFTGAVTVAIGTNPGVPPGTLSGTLTRNAVGGVATFNNLSINRSGTGYTLTASAAGTNPVTSASFNINAGLAATIDFTQQPPASAQAGQTLSPAIQISARDALGNTATGFTGNVTLSLTPGAGKAGANLLGTRTRAAVSGVATFDNLSVDSAAAGYTLTATATGLPSVISSAFTINPGPTTRLAFTVQPPASTSAGTVFSPAIQVSAQDAFGNLTPAFTQTVTITIGNNPPPSNGVLDGDPTVAAVAGVATFSTLNIDEVGTGYTLIAARAGLVSDESAPFNITPALPSVLAFTVQPSSAVANAPITPAIQVTARDVFGNTATSFTGNVTLAIGTNPPGTGVLDGTTVVAAVAGVATFSTINIDEAGAGYTLTASATGLTGTTSSPFNITPGPATQMAISAGNAQTATVGTAVAVAPSVIVRDAFNNPVPGVSVTFTVTGGGGSVVGSPAVTNASGIATITSWTLGTTPGPNTLQATSTGLTPVNFTATATVGPPTQMAISAGDGQLATVNTAVAVDPSVVVRDAFNNPVAGVQVTFAVTGGGGSVVPTTPISTNASGIATVTSWTLGTTAGANTLQASATGLTPVTFNATGTAGAATQMAINAGNNQSATVGTAVAVAPSVIVRDAFNNLVQGVSVTFAVTSGGGSVAGSPATTNASGIAAITNWTLGSTAGTNTLQASATGLTPVSFTATGTAGAATQMAINAGNNQSATVGTAVAIAPSVIVRDAFNNPVAGVSVTFAVTGGGGSVSGSPAVTGVNGIATLTSWTLGTTAGANTLAASATGITPVSFTATGTAGAATQMAVSAGNNQSATVGTAVAVDPAVIVRDQFNNPVAGVSVTFAVTGGGGSVVGSPAVTGANGIATITSWTLGPTTGTNTLQASATGLTPVGFTATATAGNATQLAFTQQPTSTTAGATITPAIQVTARDAQGNPATGFTGNITLAIGTNPPGNGALDGTTTVAAVAGVATFTVDIDEAGTGYTLTANATGLTGTTSSAFNITAGAATQMAVSAGNNQSAPVGTAVAVDPAVIVRDQFNNPVQGVSVTFAVTGGGGTVVPTTPIATNASGIATVTSWTLGPTAGTNNNTLQATSAGLTGSPLTFTASGTAGNATQLAFTQQPTSTTAGTTITPAIQVTARDAQGNTATGFTGNITLAIGTNPLGTGALDGTTVVAAVAGVATFSVDIDEAGTGYTLTANAAGLTGTTSSAFNITAGAATQLAFTQQPTSTTAGTTISPAVQVTARDQFGNTATGFTANVTLAIGINPPGTGALDGTTVVAAVAGVATFGVDIDEAGTGYTLTASASGLTGATSNPFNITAGAAAQLVFSVPPGNSTAGAPITPAIQVAAQDQFGNTVPSYTNMIAMSIGTNPSSGSLSGTTTKAAVGGVATFDNLSINAAGTGYTLVASRQSGPQLPSVTSAPFNVTAGAATQIGLNAGNNQTATVNTAVATPPSVIVRDASSNPVAGVAVTFAVAGGGGSLTGAGAVTNAGGIATVGSWTLGTTAGTNNNTLTATAGGLTGSPVTFTASATAGPATQMAINAGNNQTATVNTAVAIAPSVIVRDQFNNPVQGVSVTFAVTGGGGAVVPTTPIATNASGIATVTSWTLGPTAGTNNNTLEATSAGLTGSPLTFTASGAAGNATQLAFTQQPTSATAGTTITPAIQVTARDAQGNTATSFTGNVTLAIGTNPPPGAGALDGTTTVAAVAGVATFSVDIDEAGTGYTLTANATGLTGATSTAFNITAGAASQMTISAGNGQLATAGTAVAVAPAVLVTDGFGNPVANVSVTFTVTGGDGSITPPSPATVQTNASGIAALTTWTLGLTPGPNTVEATSGSLTPVTFTATGQ